MRLIKGNVERIADNEAAIEKLRAMGYQDTEAEVAGSVRKEVAKGASEMSLAQLKAVAKEKGIEGAASLTKEELLAVLKDVI